MQRQMNLWWENQQSESSSSRRYVLQLESELDTKLDSSERSNENLRTRADGKVIDQRGHALSRLRANLPTASALPLGVGSPNEGALRHDEAGE